MRKPFFILVVALLAAVAGCETAKSKSANGLATKELDAAGAASLAAKLANDECHSRFGLQPFKAGDYAAKFQEGRWHWGYMDPGGPAGYSTVVSFDRDGRNSEAEVYYSSDQVAEPLPEEKPKHDFGTFTPNDPEQGYPSEEPPQ